MTDYTDPAAREALQRLADKATSGPWSSFAPLRLRPDLYSVEAIGAHELRRGDAEFIAASREAAPALLDLIDQLTRWKAEALTVMGGLQELGKALGLPLGVQITGPAALEAVNQLKAERDRHGPCICNTGPGTDGPDELCPRHGRIYAELLAGWEQDYALAKSGFDAEVPATRQAEAEVQRLRDGITALAKGLYAGTIESVAIRHGIKQHLEALLTPQVQDKQDEPAVCPTLGCTGGYAPPGRGHSAACAQAHMEMLQRVQDVPECDHPGIEHGIFSHVGICPHCRKCKFIGHGPLCGDCATTPDKPEASDLMQKLLDSLPRAKRDREVQDKPEAGAR